MNANERDHLLRLRDEHRRRLDTLEIQVARSGISTPPHIRTEIDDINQQIVNINKQISGAAVLINNDSSSFYQIRAILEDIKRSIDNLELGASHIVITEEHVVSLFGIRVLSYTVVITYAFKILIQAMFATSVLAAIGLIAATAAGVPLPFIISFITGEPRCITASEIVRPLFGGGTIGIIRYNDQKNIVNVIVGGDEVDGQPTIIRETPKEDGEIAGAAIYFGTNLPITERTPDSQWVHVKFDDGATNVGVMFINTQNTTINIPPILGPNGTITQPAQQITIPSFNDHSGWISIHSAMCSNIEKFPLYKE